MIKKYAAAAGIPEELTPKARVSRKLWPDCSARSPVGLLSGTCKWFPPTCGWPVKLTKNARVLIGSAPADRVQKFFARRKAAL